MSRSGEIVGTHPGNRFEMYLDRSGKGLKCITLAQPWAQDADISAGQLAGLARRIYESRRARTRFFNDSLLGEPVWDMLLALYWLPTRHERVSVTGLCQAAAVPVTTGMRWSQVMEQRGLIERRPDLHDGRRIHLTLSKRGEELMSAYLSAIYPKLALA